MKLGSSDHGIVSHLNKHLIEIASNLICEGDLIKEVFGQKLSKYDVKQFSNKAILCPTNDVTDRINEKVLKLLEGELCIYLSSDSF